MKTEKIFSILKLVANFIFAAVISDILIKYVDSVSGTNEEVYKFVVVVLVLLCCISCSGLYYFYKDKEKANKKLLESNKTSEDLSVGKGDAYLLMSLTQNLDEPLKIKYLEKAAIDYRNELACLILANLYSSGIKKSGKVVLEKNHEKAAYFYRYMVGEVRKDVKFDNHGVANWQLGYYYEKAIINRAKRIPKNARYKKAIKYYKISATKGFGKASNSLAKFYKTMSIHVLEHNENTAEVEYNKARNYGDIYATINLGIVLKEKYQNATVVSRKAKYLDEARECFEEAVKFDSPEAYYQLADVCRIMASDKSMILDRKSAYYYAKKSALCCADAISKGPNKFSAAAYYVLGKLTEKYKFVSRCTKVKSTMGIVESSDFVEECFMRSLDQFKTLGSSSLENIYENYYLELHRMFPDN